MTVSYESLMALQRQGLRVSYTDKDTMLYALSVGMGMHGADEHSLSFVFEGRPLQAVPSMATVLMRVPVLESGVDFKRLLHGEQRLTLHRPIPATGELVVDTGVAQVIDKGPEKGSVVIFESRARTPDGVPVFTTQAVMLARGNGGIGGPAGTLPPPHSIAQRALDRTIDISTRPDQALLYRLNEDRNPLHVDPMFAKRAGFEQPIMHGLCTYGLICGALVLDVCAGDASKMAAFDVRFVSPVFPGEPLALDLWIDDDVVSFRCRAVRREQTVIDNGRCVLKPAS